MSDYFTPAEVAAKLGVSEVSVRRYVKSGKIPGFKVGGSIRIPRNFEETLASQQQSDKTTPNGKPPAA